MATDIIEHLRIDRLCCATERQFPEGGEVRFGEEMVERPRRLVRDIDLALLEPLDQLIGRNIHHLDLSGFEHPIRHCLAYPDPGEGGDHVV
jgi:hypothetical protein